MSIAVGERFPEIKLQSVGEGGMPTPLDLSEWLKDRTCVIFGLPGAFTPTCSQQHLPGFVAQAQALSAKGVDAIGCHSVNDAFVLGAWAKAHGADSLTMIADGSAILTKALGLELDLTEMGLGLRCQRYAMVIENGVVTYLGVEPGQTFGVCSAEAVLEAI